ncbi:cell division transport system ATP-binding protein [Pseudoalteromonas ulvae UL12]|uniref:Cell division ATP-binding protein FtsE n=1 Tax=Pseudoalteromonas ulvae TaxID=107327 RepID=A0A244CQ45_PSEDV|nr:cell division ATP-binding protein FtsE [Pseudoalteromonas ulvae]MBE0365185.1 cell division transport system ATP-binding protein [Pseudoalteromonas ulvae UL12]OUL57731.1 cell division ATP-binding protein FtsE [Pseudoalteromonas ulvae]
MIKFQQVSKTYPGGHLALEKVSFHLEPGELAFLTGHSGAGKSTLLKLISLMERPSAGEVFINGVKLNQLSTKQVPFVRRDIGMIFQNHRLLNRYNIFDNVAFPLVIEGMHRKDIEKRVHAALDRVGLLSKVKCYPDTLSGGEQQRVGIARAIVNSPPILLADEPTGNLDPELSVEILNLFKDFNQQGTTVLIATHDLGLIARMKYRSLTLKKGRLIDDLLSQEGV